MNTTGLVGYIALLMVVGASLGGKHGGNFPVSHLRGDVMSYESISDRMGNGILETTPQRNTSGGTASLMSRAVKTSSELANSSQFVRVYIDGIAYEGTIYPVRNSLLEK